MQRLSLFPALLLILLVSGCAGDVHVRNELTSARAELRELKKERAMYRKSVDDMWDNLERERYQWMDKTHALQQQIRQLEERHRQCMRIESKLSSCENQLQQVETWAGALAAGYGPGIWVSRDYLRPVYGRKPARVTVEGVVEELNERHRRYNNPLLVLKRMDGSTLVVGVSDDLKLTTQMGSSGAHDYLQTAAYSLTSLESVDCVTFEFEEGDHASPGRFCR